MSSSIVLDRVVRRDCTFLLQNRFYEAPPHLAGETIEARFDPLDPAVVEIYFQGQLQGTLGAARRSSRQWPVPLRRAAEGSRSL